MLDQGSLKDIARSFLTLAASGNVDEAYAKHVDPAFIHHNQYFKGDRASLMEAMKESSRQTPNKAFEVKQLIQEGDQVVAYSRVKTDAAEIAVVHILKIKDGLIVEMWDLGQVLSKDSPNENGMF
jgi:predicted SnoaL-like aldol condensation-catalyzing enzyme